VLFQPIVSFRDGWSDTISWFKVALDNNSALRCSCHKQLSRVSTAGKLAACFLANARRFKRKRGENCSISALSLIARHALLHCQAASRDGGGRWG
jgi:hypothetical protein